MRQDLDVQATQARSSRAQGVALRIELLLDGAGTPVIDPGVTGFHIDRMITGGEAAGSFTFC